MNFFIKIVINVNRKIKMFVDKYDYNFKVRNSSLL